MDISTVAKRSGVPASTLRYYEDKGLIQSVGRKGLQRLFAANILERLALIALGRVAGFSLDEISNILEAGENPDIDREMLLTKATELDRTIQKLTAMRDGLQHAAACTAPSHLECPRFRRLMGLAASGAIKGQPSNIAKPISR
ncbi:helix-turn-helix domain-containing protein [Paraglaciecola chathamensis]|uniref:helix-turn-helix domain-containing protein n=1 Tax=Paraglaciecola chathamensis TaxID=368405 RepID=UPI0026F66DF0|nr:helix-turn-helix domain-containing protein [Paraglaciecola chathamensis]MDO6558703.1 helix-turn-helix domain-containing protein [Paraglaciecola chathamensis]